MLGVGTATLVLFYLPSVNDGPVLGNGLSNLSEIVEFGF
jgi:hypothetical protein